MIATWSPRLSPVRIEYSRTLLRSLARREDQPDHFGLLYGEHSSWGARVLAANPQPGLRVVGSFAARARGEIFLTESDLERLHGLDPRAIALVIAGDNGGFFVREREGSMRTIKSYQEFPVRPPRSKAMRRESRWVALVLAAIMAIAILVWPSQAFTIQGQPGAVRIAIRRGTAGHLEIVDGPERHWIAISPTLTSVVYSPRTTDVKVRLVR